MTSHAIIEQIKSLPLEEQIEVAEAVDRITWAQRWRRICESIESRAKAGCAADEQTIDAAVAEVRREKPLSERSSTRRSS